ncbi:MAG: phage shock protein E [Flavobacteriales bacterium]|jgi:phage shock protein E
MNNEIWIDVRAEDEYAQGHLKDAILIPNEIIEDKIEAAVSDKNTTIRLYCRTGRRSGIANDILHGLGYVNATNEGGYEDLLAKGQS